MPGGHACPGHVARWEKVTRTVLPARVRRLQLLEAAVTVIASKGYAATSVDDIVEEAGVARGTLYLHFAGKEAVFLALVDEFLARLRLHFDERRRAARPVTADTLRDRILESVTSWLAFFEENRTLSAVVLLEAAGLEPVFHERWGTVKEEIRAHLLANIRSLQASGLFRSDRSPEALVVFFSGMLHECVCGYLLTEPDPDIRWLAGELVDFELWGLVPPEGSRTPASPRR